MHIYLGRWVWNKPEDIGLDDGEFRAPLSEDGDYRGNLSIRTGVVGATSGLSLFVYDRAVTDPGLTILTDDPQGIVSRTRIDALQQAILPPRSFTETRLHDIFWEMFNLMADPTGQTRWRKGLQPRHTGELNLWLGGVNIKRVKRLEIGAPEWVSVRNGLHSMYRKMRQRSDSDPRSLNLHRRWLSVQMEKFRVSDQTLFIPGDEEIVEPLPHHTTYTDDFTTDTDQTLSEYNSDYSMKSTQNVLEAVDAMSDAVVGGSESSWRLNLDLDSVDHKATGTKISGGTNSWRQTAARMESDNYDNFYAADKNSVANYRLKKHYLSTFTQLGSTHNESGTNTPMTVECSGSDITLLVNGVIQGDTPVTDEDLDDGIRCGGSSRGAAFSSRFDDWSAEDLVVGGGAIPHGPLGHPLHGPLAGPI